MKCRASLRKIGEKAVCVSVSFSRRRSKKKIFPGATERNPPLPPSGGSLWEKGGGGGGGGGEMAFPGKEEKEGGGKIRTPPRNWQFLPGDGGAKVERRSEKEKGPRGLAARDTHTSHTHTPKKVVAASLAASDDARNQLTKVPLASSFHSSKRKKRH